MHTGRSVIAYVDRECQPHPTIRHKECYFLLEHNNTKRCPSCESHRKGLYILLNRHRNESSKSKITHNSHSNFRYLTTPQMVKRLRGIHFNQERTMLQLDRLRAQLEVVTREEGVEVNEELHQDLKEIMSNHDTQITSSFPPNSFQKLFWSQQQKAASLPSRNVRWHPLMIKWCLYLKHLSSKAYETIRERGCIALPSQRTLRDYSHCIHSSSGFS